MVEISRDVSSSDGAVEEDKQSAASHNVSLFFGIRYVGVFITAYLSGFLLEYMDKRDSIYSLFFLKKVMFCFKKFSLLLLRFHFSCAFLAFSWQKKNSTEAKSLNPFMEKRGKPYNNQKTKWFKIKTHHTERVRIVIAEIACVSGISSKDRKF